MRVRRLLRLPAGATTPRQLQRHALRTLRKQILWSVVSKAVTALRADHCTQTSA